MAQTYPELRQLQPEDENRLECKIPGEVVEHDAQGKTLNEVEESKDDPVRKPLHIILGTWTFNRLEREISR